MTGIEIVVEDDAWSAAIPAPEALAARCFAAVAARETRLDGAVAVLLTDDAQMRRLNNQFRGQDKATNVLSFPAGADGFVGDIAIAYGVCVREAAENQAPVDGYAAHLLVHGLLHLVGYDHEVDADAEIMEALESEILDVLGVYNPYAAEESDKA